MFPKIDAPCPLKRIQFTENATFYCGHCSRTVYNLDRLSNDERQTLAQRCNTEKVCVAYSVKKHLRSTAAIAGLFLVSATGHAVAAETVNLLDDQPSVVKNCEDAKSTDHETASRNNVIDSELLEMVDIVTMGGVSDVSIIENAADESVNSLELIPVVIID